MGDQVPRPRVPRGVPFAPTEASLAESERLARSVMANDGEVLDGAPKIGSSMLVVMPEVHLGLVLRVNQLQAGVAAIRSLVVSDSHFSRADVVRILNTMMEGANVE